MAPGASARCLCGHDRSVHEHYRRGTDCALCGSGGCPRFRRHRGGVLALARAAIGRLAKPRAAGGDERSSTRRRKRAPEDS